MLGIRMDHHDKVDLILVLLALVAAGAGFAGGLLSHAPTFTVTRTHNRSVEEQYGRPSQTVNGSQVNQGLSGLTCDVYVARKTVICHP